MIKDKSFYKLDVITKEISALLIPYDMPFPTVLVLTGLEELTFTMGFGYASYHAVTFEQVPCYYT